MEAELLGRVAGARRSNARAPNMMVSQLGAVELSLILVRVGLSSFQGRTLSVAGVASRELRNIPVLPQQAAHEQLREKWCVSDVMQLDVYGS